MTDTAIIALTCGLIIAFAAIAAAFGISIMSAKYPSKHLLVNLN